MQRIVRCLAGMVSCGLFVACAAIEDEPVQPEEGLQGLPADVTFDGEWYWWGESAFLSQIEDSIIEEVIGDPLAGGGCAYEWGQTFTDDPPPGKIWVGLEVAQVPEDCRVLVEFGTVPAEAAAVGPDHSLDDSFSDAGADEVAARIRLDQELDHVVQPAAHEPYAWYSRGRWTKTFYEDPIWITVTGVTAFLRWNYSYWSAYTTQYGAQWQHFGPSGWERLGASNGYRNYNSTSVYAWVYGYFRNQGFCVGNTTYNKYNTTRQWGYANGDYRYTQYTTKWGGCHWLLRPGVQIGSW